MAAEVAPPGAVAIRARLDQQGDRQIGGGLWKPPSQSAMRASQDGPRVTALRP